MTQAQAKAYMIRQSRLYSGAAAARLYQDQDASEAYQAGAELSAACQRFEEKKTRMPARATRPEPSHQAGAVRARIRAACVTAAALTELGILDLYLTQDGRPFAMMLEYGQRHRAILVSL